MQQPMRHFSDMIEQDLKNLVSETKRKYPQIKEEVQNALNSLVHAKQQLQISQNSQNSVPSQPSNFQSQQQQKQQQQKQQQQSQLNLVPIKSIFGFIGKLGETRNQKVIEYGMSILQKLSNIQILDRGFQMQMLDFLSQVTVLIQNQSFNDANFELKVVQLVLVQVNTKFIDFLSLEPIEKILNICMALLVKKHVLIHDNCIVGAQTLMHIIFKIFSQLAQKQKLLESNRSYSELSPKNKQNQNNINSNEVNSQGSLGNSQQQQNTLIRKISLKKMQSFKHEKDIDLQLSSHNSEVTDSQLTALQQPKQLEQIQKNAQKIYNDFANFYLENTAPNWIPKQELQKEENLEVYKTICLDLFIFILKETGDSIEILNTKAQEIEQKTISQLEELLVQEKVEFQQSVRLFRLILRLQVNLKCCFKVYQKIFQYMQKNQKISLYTYIIVEQIAEFLKESRVILSLVEKENTLVLQTSQDEVQMNNSQVQEDSLKFAFRCVSFAAKMISVVPVKEIQTCKLGNIKQNIIAENWTDFPAVPSVTYFQVFKSILECSSAFSDTVLSIIQHIPNVIVGQKIVKEQFSQAELQEINFISLFLRNYWQENQKVAKYVIKFDINETVNQYILNFVQNWISICGTLGLQKQRDAFLKLLSQQSIEDENKFTAKNTQCAKTMFNIIHGLQNILDTSSWHIIFQTMQKLQLYFNKKSLQQEEDSYQNLQTDSEIQILSSLLEQTFTRSASYSNEQLLQIIDALNTATLSNLEQKALEEERAKNKGDYQNLNEKFALNKMFQVVSLNLERVYMYWDLIEAHFLCIANSKHDNLRLYSLEVLNNVTNLVFQFFFELYSFNQQEGAYEYEIRLEKDSELLQEMNCAGSRWNAQLWQETVFSLFLEIIKSSFNDIKEELLKSLLKFLQNNGHSINGNGLKVILNVLNQVSLINYGRVITSYAFHCLEIIINQHILQIQNKKQIGILLNLIEHFKQISQDQNITYLSVAMYWNVSDHLTNLHIQYLQSTTQEDELESPLKKQQSKNKTLENMSNSINSGVKDTNQNEDQIVEEAQEKEQNSEQKKSLESTPKNLKDSILSEVQEKNIRDLVDFEILWSSLFEKLTKLCVERSQDQVRQQSLHTYTQIIINNSQKIFSSHYLNKILGESYLGLIDDFIEVIEKENQKNFQQMAQQLQTPTFNVAETPKFTGFGQGQQQKKGFNFQGKVAPQELPQVQTFVDMKDWLEILKQSVTALIKLMKKILKPDQNNQQQKINNNIKLVSYKHKFQLKEQIISDLLLKVIRMQKMEYQELNLENQRLLKELIQNTQILYLSEENTKKLFDAYNSLVDISPKEQKEAKFLAQKVLPQILENFEIFFTKKKSQNNKQQQQQQKQLKKDENLEKLGETQQIAEYFTVLYKKILKYLEMVDKLNILSPFKVWDNCAIYENIQNIVDKISFQPKAIKNVFFQFIKEILEKKMVKKSAICDQYIRSFYKALVKFVVNGIRNEGKCKFLEPQINFLNQETEQLMELVYDNEYLELYNSFPKKLKVNPLWAMVANTYLEFCKCEIQREDSNLEFLNTIEMIVQRNSEQLDEIKQEHKLIVFEKIQEVELNCIDFVISELKSEKELTQNITDRLVEIMQIYIETLEDAQKKGDNLLENHNELQRKFLQNLFQICDMNQSDNNQFLKLSKTVVPILIFKCRQTLLEFYEEENQSQQKNQNLQQNQQSQNHKQQKNPQNIQEVQFILNQLLKLELPPNCFAEINIPKTPRRHAKKSYLLKKTTSQQSYASQKKQQQQQQQQLQQNQNLENNSNNNIINNFSSPFNIQPEEGEGNQNQQKQQLNIMSPTFGGGENKQFQFNSDNNINQQQQQSQSLQQQQQQNENNSQLSQQIQNSNSANITQNSENNLQDNKSDYSGGPLFSQNLIKIQGDNPFLKGKKGHLIYLLPLFTSMMLTQEKEILVLIQKIFIEITKEMSLLNFSDNNTLDNE